MLKKNNVPSSLEGISWAGNIKNMWNKPPNSANSIKTKAPTAEEKEIIKIKRLIKGYIEKSHQLILLELKEKREELSLLNELDELENEIEEDNNKKSIITPFFQLLNPLNFLMPLSRLRKLTNWLNETPIATVLKEKRVKKLNELGEITKGIELLKKLAERESQELFTLKDEIQQRGLWEELKDQRCKLQDLKKNLVLQDQEIKRNMDEYNDCKAKIQAIKNRFENIINECAQQIIRAKKSICRDKRNALKKNIETEQFIKYLKESIKYAKDEVSKIENYEALLNSRDINPTAILQEEIDMQRASLGLKGPDFSYDELSLDENFLYLTKKWEKREELVCYFTELPFAEGFPDNGSHDNDMNIEEWIIKSIVMGFLIGLLGLWFYTQYINYQNMLTPRLKREKTKQEDWKQGPWDWKKALGKEWEKWKNWQEEWNWQQWNWQHDWDWKREWHLDWEQEWAAGERYREKRAVQQDNMKWIRKWDSGDKEERKIMCTKAATKLFFCKNLEPKCSKKDSTTSKSCIKFHQEIPCEKLLHCEEYISLDHTLK